MAMAVCNKKFIDDNITDWEVDSAGLSCSGGKISDNSVKALEKIGINLNDYQAKRFDVHMINSADVFVVMTQMHKEILMFAGVAEEKIHILGGGIPDPYGGDEKVYENCLNKIIKGVDALFKEGVFD